MAHKPGVIHFHNRLSISVRGISVKALPSSRHNGTIRKVRFSLAPSRSFFIQIHPHNGFCQIGRLQNIKLSMKPMDGYCFQLVFVCSFSLSLFYFLCCNKLLFHFCAALSFHQPKRSSRFVNYLLTLWFFVCFYVCVFVRLL